MKKAKRLTAVILSIAIIVISMLPATFAVTYPDNISKQDVLGTITDLDNLTIKAISLSSEKSLSDAVYDSLCCDRTLNSLFSSVYGEIAGNESVLSALGVNLSPAALSACLAAYPSVASAIASCKNLKAAVALAPTLVWNVSGRDAFADACAAMFAPFNNLLFTLLCSGSIKLNDYMAIRGADGYTNAIIPLFEALECPQIIPQADFTAAATSARSSMVKNIVSMLYLSIDSLLEAPVSGLSSVLPHLAWYLGSGGLSSSLNTLLSPLSLRIGILTIPGITSLFSGISNIENSDNLSGMLKNIDISSLTGSDAELNLPDIDLEALAQCGSVDENGKFVSDRADALVTIMHWLVQALKNNSSVLLSQIDASYSDIVNALLAKDEDALVKSFFVILTASETPRNKIALYSYPEVQPATATMPEGLTTDDLETVVRGMDGLINEIIMESDPEGSLEDTLRKTIYSNKVLASLMTGLYGALDSSDFSQAFEMLGISTSTVSVSYKLTDYPSVARVLKGSSSWKSIDTSKLSFGFEDGSKDGFRRALVAVLKPFENVLSFLLAGDTVTVADTFRIRGTNGYATVVIPLLEALGCDNQTIVAYSAFARSEDAVLADIINPILALTDKICEAPVEMLCTILPNAVYFLNSGILPEMVKNLLYPITSLLSDAGLSELLPDDMFGEISEFNIDSLTKDLDLTELLGKEIALPEIKLSAFASFGTPEDRVSKMSSNGTSVRYTYVVADRPAVMVTILRFLVDALSMEENRELLSGLMSSGDSDDMMSMYAGNITSKFADMTTDEILVWLYGLFFRETPPVEIDDTPEVIPTIIYRPDNSLSAGQIAGIAAGVVILALFVIWILLRLGYLEGLQTGLDKIKRKREKKKQAKQKKKQQAQMEKARNRTDVVYSSQLDGAGRRGMKTSGKSAAAKPAAGKAPAAAQTAKPQTKAAPPVQKASVNPMHTDKQTLKLEKQQMKAAKKALKNTKKADRYYNKALKKSVKK